jgi:hypothetical protein
VRAARALWRRPLASDLDDRYARAFIDGLAESVAPVQRLCEVIERFASNPWRRLQLNIAWALEKRVDDGLSDGMLEGVEIQSSAQ